MDFSVLFENVNWVAVLCAMVASMVWGFVWYSKSVAGNPWMKAAGVNEKQLEKAYMSRVMPIVLAMGFVSALAVAVLLQGAQGWFDGMADGAIIGIGLAASQVLTMYAFALRPWNLMIIDGVWVIVNFALIRLIVGIFA